MRRRHRRRRLSPEYRAYIQSEAWRQSRQRALERDRWRCQRCGSSRRLHVHHRTYARLGQEWLGDLVTLCARCHRRAHRGGGRMQKRHVGFVLMALGVVLLVVAMVNAF